MHVLSSSYCGDKAIKSLKCIANGVLTGLDRCIPSVQANSQCSSFLT